MLCKICQKNETDSTLGICFVCQTKTTAIEKIPLVQFFVTKENKIEIMVNEGIYENEKIFKETIREIQKWLKFQLPNMKQTLENYKRKRP